MSYYTGDIVMMHFPFAEKSEYKHRPVYIASKIDELGDFIGCKVTKTLTGNDLSLELDGNLLKSGNLKFDCEIQANKLITLNVKNIPKDPIMRLNKKGVNLMKELLKKNFD